MEEKFSYFMKRTEKDLEAINKKLDALITFRFMLIGAASAISIIFSVGTTLIVLFLKNGG